MPIKGCPPLHPFFPSPITLALQVGDERVISGGEKGVGSLCVLDEGLEGPRNACKRRHYEHGDCYRYPPGLLFQSTTPFVVVGSASLQPDRDFYFYDNLLLHLLGQRDDRGRRFGVMLKCVQQRPRLVQ